MVPAKPVAKGRPGYTPAFVQPRKKGRRLARVVRVEFDAAYLGATALEKARAAALKAPPLIRGTEGEEDWLVRHYEKTLASVSYVSRRTLALQAFESAMDVPTAVCLAEAAKQNPAYAVLRRRLRQMDERKRFGGDQREQFGQLMRYLQGWEIPPPRPGGEEQYGTPQRFSGGDDGPEDAGDGEAGGDPPDEEDAEPLRLEPPWGAGPGR